MNKKVNNLDQVAYVRRYTLTDTDIKVVEIYNGVLRVLLNESKALDIMQLFHNGTNISYISKNGFTKRETNFLKRFEGGMLYTCGIDVVGGQKGYEDHGSVHNIPAVITRCECNESEIIVEAIVRDSALFGKNLVLKRTYKTKVGSGSITLNDTIINEGYRDENYSILYHVNIGYPMLDDGVIISGDITEITPRTEWAKKNIDTALLITDPEDNREETCYYLKLKSPKVCVTNKKLSKIFTLEYSNDTLPYFVEWKSMASGDYALGLEPSTTMIDDHFKFDIIKKQSEVNFGITIKIKDS